MANQSQSGSNGHKPQLVTTTSPTLYTQEAEESVLGSILVDPAAFVTLAAIIGEDDFFLLRHRYIWQALHRLHERDDEIDYVTVVQELKALGYLDEIGGPAYLTYIASQIPTSVHAEVYARLVQRYATRRDLAKAAQEIQALAEDEALELESVLEQSETKLFAVSEQSSARKDSVPLWDAVSDLYDRMEVRLQDKSSSTGLPTGYTALDDLIGGLHRSDLIYLGARPAMGKTSLLLCIALNAARMGARVGLFTMEMNVEQITMRLISMDAGIDLHRLRTAQLNPDEVSRFTESIGRIGNLPVYIDDAPMLTPEALRMKTRRLQHEHGLDLVLVDYVQLMESNNYRRDRQQEMSYISRRMKELARELNVPVMAAAQLSRNLERRGDKRPQLSDLRESGTLEQDADVVMFLYRDEVYNEQTEVPGRADIIVAKHRNGPTGVADLYFDRGYARFQNAEKPREIDLSDL